MDHRDPGELLRSAEHSGRSGTGKDTNDEQNSQPRMTGSTAESSNLGGKRLLRIGWYPFMLEVRLVILQSHCASVS